MNHRAIAAMMASLAPVVRDYFGNAIAPFVQRLDSLETRAPAKGERGEKGEPGLDGKDGAVGRDGVDGKDGAPGERGEKGEPGLDGKDVPPLNVKQIADAIRSMPEITEVLQASIAEYVAANPPKDGAPGERGEKGDPGRDGRDGLPGVPGLPGEKGLDGKDGKDGRGFDNIKIGFDGERTITWLFTCDDEIKEFPIRIPWPLDRGVWKDRAYEQGDEVSFGGSMWIAQCDTTGKPEMTRDWRLAVKRGRDGKDGKDGAPGERGAEGKPGRDGQDKW